MHFRPRIRKFRVKPKHIPPAHISPDRMLLQHLLLPARQTLQRPDQFRLICFKLSIPHLTCSNGHIRLCEDFGVGEGREVVEEEQNDSLVQAYEQVFWACVEVGAESGGAEGMVPV
jgi:hypothetical protein